MILSEAEVKRLEALAKSNWSGDPLTAAKSLLSLIGSHEELRRERDEAAMFIRRLCVSGCANHVVKQANDWLRCKLLHNSIRDKGATP